MSSYVAYTSLHSMRENTAKFEFLLRVTLAIAKLISENQNRYSSKTSEKAEATISGLLL